MAKIEEQKPWYTSKVVWINAVTFVTLALSLDALGALVPAAATKGVTALSAVLNLWLRLNGAAPNLTLTEASAKVARKEAHKGVKGAAILALAAALGASGCGKAGPNLRPVAIASETFSVALKGLQSQFIVWADAGAMPRETEQRWQTSFFKPAAQIGLAVDAAVRAGDHASVVANANAAMTLVESLIRDEVVKLNPGQRGAVSVALTSIRGFILIWQTLQPPAQASVGSVTELHAMEAN